jgi:hypothetical protein
MARQSKAVAVHGQALGSFSPRHFFLEGCETLEQLVVPLEPS